MSVSTSAEVLAAVGDLLPTLRDRAQETEDLRRIPDATIAALQDTGFFRLLQPVALPGFRGDAGRVLPRGPRDRERLRFDRLGVVGARRAPVAARHLRRPRAAGGVEPTTRPR